MIVHGNTVELLKAAADMPPARARMVLAAIAAKEDSARDVAAAFERDMQPVCKALVSALRSGDMEALRGFRGLLPHLLAEVNESPELADVLAFHLGKSLLNGLRAKPEEAL